VIEEPDSTTLVLLGQVARVDSSGSVIVVEAVPARSGAAPSEAVEAHR
jgi:hypothetical protein